MLDVISGGRLVAGLPVGTAMDTDYAYGETPISLREKYREAHDLIMQGLDVGRTVRFQRQVHPVALREYVAATDTEAPPSDLGSRWRQHRDAGVDHPARVPLGVPELRRLPGRQVRHGQLLEAWSTTWARSRTRIAPASCSSLPSPRRTSRLKRTTRRLPSTSTRVPAHRPWIRRRAPVTARCVHLRSGVRSNRPSSSSMFAGNHAAGRTT